MAATLFNPAELENIQTLIEENVIPRSLSRTRFLCRTGKLPAVKDGCHWKTTRAAVRGYFYKGANKAFRRLAV